MAKAYLIKGIDRRKTIKQSVEQMQVMAGLKKPTKPKQPRKLETKKRNLKEKRIEKEILLSLNLIPGIIAAKSGEQSTYNSNKNLDGMSDIIVFIEFFGVIFMEVKQESERKKSNGGLRDTQVKFQEICKQCNLLYYVVYNREEAIRIINQFKPEIKFNY